MEVVHSSFAYGSMEVVHMEVWKLCIVLLCMTRAPYDINSTVSSY